MKRARRGRIGVYGKKTRSLQSRLTAEVFALSFKDANIYMYLGSRDSVEPHINDIQNQILFENPDRAYSTEPINIAIGMEPLGEAGMDFSMYGIINPMGDEQTFRVHPSEFECLGRELIIGDVMEIPFFEKDCKKAYWEITDVDDKPSYEKFYYVIKAKVMDFSRKTREIPTNRTNEDIMGALVDDMDIAFNEQISDIGLEPEPSNEPVDYRDKQQASFLDDPNQIFNGE